MDEEIFSAILEKIRDLYIKNNNEVSYSGFNGIISGDSIFDTPLYYGWSQFSQIMVDYSYAKKLYDINLTFRGLPCDTNGNPKAFIERGIAININSKHKNDAFKFVEYLMSYDLVAGRDSISIRNSNITLPVNIKAYEVFKNDFNGSPIRYSYDSPENMMATIPLPDDIAEEYIKLIESPTVCEFNGQATYIYYNLARDTLRDYYTQKIDFDTMMEQLQRKLSLYYSE